MVYKTNQNHYYAIEILHSNFSELFGIFRVQSLSHLYVHSITTAKCWLGFEDGFYVDGDAAAHTLLRVCICTTENRNKFCRENLMGNPLFGYGFRRFPVC